MNTFADSHKYLWARYSECEAIIDLRKLVGKGGTTMNEAIVRFRMLDFGKPRIAGTFNP